jgi:hypothetical protein
VEPYFHARTRSLMAWCSDKPKVLAVPFFLEYAVAKCMLLQGVVLGVAEENYE